MGETIILSDEELLRKTAGGDEAAFTALYRRRQAPVYRFALQMSGSEAVAEEVTQEVFLLLIREPHRYDPRVGPVAAWLYGVARNLVLRHLERDRRHLVLDEESGPEPASSEDVAGEHARRQEIEIVRRAVLTLPPRYREVVVLCELHELSYEEAAAVLGCAIGTVRSRLHRARELLAGKLRAPARCLV